VVLAECDVTFDDLQEWVHDVNKGDVELDHKLVAGFVRVMIRKWGEELNGREDSEKMGVKGRIEAGTYAQTR